MDATAEREFEQFVQASATRLRSLATLVAGDPHKAEDLLQTALAKTYLKWPTAREHPVAYVRRVMINQRTDWWRRDRDREEPLDGDVEDADTGDLADTHADRDTIVRALLTLTKRQRLIVVLRYLEDLSEAQVAAELRISVGTVKGTLARALAKLRVQADSPTHLAGTPEVRA